MSLLDGFVTFNFNEGAPYVSFTKNGVTFNKGVVMKLGRPENVVLLINAKDKQIAVQVCPDFVPNATAFYKEEKKSNVLSVRWNGRDLLNTISEITGWDLNKESYRVLGTYIPDESAMLFDLSNAEPLT